MIPEPPTTTLPPQRISRLLSPSPACLAGLGIGLTALLSILPFLLERQPVDFVADPTALAEVAGKSAVIALMLGAVALRAWVDRREERHAGWIATGLVALSGLMTGCHYLIVDREPRPAEFQREI